MLSDPDGDSDTRLLLLKEDVKDRALTTLSAEQRERLEVDKLEVREHDLTLGYDYFNAEQILRQMLPEGCEVPGSFETVEPHRPSQPPRRARDYRHLVGASSWIRTPACAPS